MQWFDSAEHSNWVTSPIDIPRQSEEEPPKPNAQ